MGGIRLKHISHPLINPPELCDYPPHTVCFPPSTHGLRGHDREVGVSLRGGAKDCAERLGYDVRNVAVTVQGFGKVARPRARVP